MTCTATPADTQFTLTYINWSFEPDASDYVSGVDRPAIQGPADSSVWSGVILWPGTVIVSATVNANVDTAEVAISVSARTTPIADTLHWPASPIATGLISNDNPSLGEHLGVTFFKFEKRHPDTSADTTHGSGPNEGYKMRKTLNLRADIEIKINRDQMKNNTNLYNRHVGLTHPNCTTAIIVGQTSSGLAAKVEAHEGTKYDNSPSVSHTRWYKDHISTKGLNATALSNLESFVYKSYTPSPNDLFEILTKANVDDLSASNRADVDTGWNPGCNLIGIKYGM